MSTKDVSTFTPQKNQIFILDTNVLIKLFYPMLKTAPEARKPYEELYRKILLADSTLLISSIQISEFINRCIRFQFGLWKGTQNENVDFKKDYRETEDYRTSMNAILDIVKLDITPHSTYISDNFNHMDPTNLYQYGFSYDFNDSLLAEIARLNNAILVTDDRDFANYSSHIPIVTGNKTLLMFHN